MDCDGKRFGLDIVNLTVKLSLLEEAQQHLPLLCLQQKKGQERVY